MATDFWSSSHYQRWIIDRATIKQARSLDILYVDNHDDEYFDFFNIYFANAIMKLARKLSLRQRVIATATVFLKRFYLKNSYCETDPFLVIAACCYVAAKAEECPVSIKLVTSEARALFSQEIYNIKSTLFDHTRIAEMEFYLVDDLECDLIVFHPYRTLTALCKPDPSTVGGTSATSASGTATTGTTPSTGKAGSTGPGTEPEEGEAEEESPHGAGVGLDDGPRYWGSGEGQLELPEGGFQHAWFVINDTYRSNLCLIYPPHLIAVASIYLTVVFHPPSRHEITPHLYSSRSSSLSTSTPPPTTTTPTSTSTSTSTNTSTKTLQSSAMSTPSAKSKTTPPDNILSFLASMNVSLPLIATIMQEIISLWTLWDRYKEDAADASSATPSASANGGRSASSSPLKPHHQRLGKGTLSTPLPSLPSATPGGGDEPTTGVADSTSTPKSDAGAAGYISGEDAVVTPAMLSNMLVRMREARIASLVQAGFNFENATGPASASASGSSAGMARAANKMLERAQAAG